LHAVKQAAGGPTRFDGWVSGAYCANVAECLQAESDRHSWRACKPFLLAAFLPLATFVFVLTGPHPWYGALPWIALPYAMAWFEGRSLVFDRSPSRFRARGRLFDLLLYALAGAYFANHWLLLRMTAMGGFLRFDTAAAFAFFGVYSAFSGIVIGHELIHRKGRVEHFIGRLVCCTLLYEHFYTEHLRGHHVRACTEEDPATARFGETFSQYFRRSVPGQWKSAFELEKRRVKARGVRDWRILRSRVVRGAAFQLLLLGAILLAFGPAALGVFVLQAFSAVRYLEGVNYFQHWGLHRPGLHQRTVDSWETPSSFTHFAMLALSCHAEHHLHASRPYQGLQLAMDSPRLARGYLGTLLLVFHANRKLMSEMTAELRSRRLGPFMRAAIATPPSEQFAHA